MKNTSLMYKIVAIIIAVIGFIGGIVCGNVFETATLKNAYTMTYEYTFNYTVMIGVWVGTLLSVLIYFGIGAILANQESILYKLNQNDNNSATTVSTNVPFADDNSNVDYEHIETLNKILNETESTEGK